MAKTIFTCPICRKTIEDDEVVTLVIKGYSRELIHFRCYARKIYREQQKKKKAVRLTS